LKNASILFISLSKAGKIKAKSANLLKKQLESVCLIAYLNAAAFYAPKL